MKKLLAFITTLLIAAKTFAAGLVATVPGTGFSPSGNIYIWRDWENYTVYWIPFEVYTNNIGEKYWGVPSYPYKGNADVFRWSNGIDFISVEINKNDRNKYPFYTFDGKVLFTSNAIYYPYINKNKYTDQSIVLVERNVMFKTFKITQRINDVPLIEDITHLFNSPPQYDSQVRHLLPPVP